MKYYIDELGGAYMLKERDTGHMISVHFSEAEAKKELRNHNLGKGFDGWTPNFMLSKPRSSINKNSKNM